jgi:hypothetical protein
MLQIVLVDSKTGRYREMIKMIEEQGVAKVKVISLGEEDRSYNSLVEDKVNYMKDSEDIIKELDVLTGDPKNVIFIGLDDKRISDLFWNVARSRYNRVYVYSFDTGSIQAESEEDVSVVRVWCKDIGRGQYLLNMRDIRRIIYEEERAIEVEGLFGSAGDRR